MDQVTSTVDPNTALQDNQTPEHAIATPTFLGPTNAKDSDTIFSNIQIKTGMPIVIEHGSFMLGAQFGKNAKFGMCY